MKSYIRGEHIALSQWWINISKLILRTSLDDIGIDIEAKLSIEENKIFDNLLEQILDDCSVMQETDQALFDGNNTKLSKFQVATIVTRTLYSAIHKLSEANRSVFTCYVSEAKDKLRAYLNKQYNVEHRKNYYTITNQNLIDYLALGWWEPEAEVESPDRQLLLQISSQLSEIKHSIANAPVHQIMSPTPPAEPYVATESTQTFIEAPTVTREQIASEVELDTSITLWAVKPMEMWWFKMNVQSVKVDPRTLALNKKRKDAKKV